MYMCMSEVSAWPDTRRACVLGKDHSHRIIHTVQVRVNDPVVFVNVVSGLKLRVELRHGLLLAGQRHELYATHTVRRRPEGRGSGSTEHCHTHRTLCADPHLQMEHTWILTWILGYLLGYLDTCLDTWILAYLPTCHTDSRAHWHAQAGRPPPSRWSCTGLTRWSCTGLTRPVEMECFSRAPVSD